MLKVKNVTKKFGGVVALDRCSVKFAAGKITALVGPNGAGKTTLLDVISGFLKPDGGAIIYNLPPIAATVGSRRGGTSYNLTRLRPDAIANLGISRTWQQVRLFKNLSIEDHLVMAASTDDHKLMRQLIRLVSLSADQAKHWRAVVGHFGINRPSETLVSELSYGQRKLLQLAMAVHRPHQLLLLDEPVAGVNKVVQKKIEQLLLHLKGRGETIVVIEHDVEFVKKLADRVVVMDEGRVLVEGRPDVVLKDKRVLEAYLGE